MGTSDKKAVTRQLIDELFNSGHYEVLDDLLAPAWVLHAFGGTHNATQLQEMVHDLRTGYPDYHCVVEDQVAEADEVATRWTVTGTHTGTLQGIPPTSRQVTFTGIAIDRIVDGKLTESWLEVDNNRMLQQLGLTLSTQG